MTSKRKRIFLLLLLVGCCSWRPGAAAAQVAVAVSLPPQQYFVRQLAGELATVAVMVPPGADPHTYEPLPSQLRQLGEARVYFAIGIEFERQWLPRWQRMNPRLLVVPLDREIDKLPLPGSRPGAGGKPDPHIWLSPSLVAKMARTMTEALVAVDPAHRETYEKRLAAWKKRLARLNRELWQLTAPRRQRQPYFLVMHPSWGYFARACGLRQLAVERQGSEPGPRSLQDLLARARELGLKNILVRPQYRGRSAGLIARALGGRVLYADPLAADWAANLKKVARQLSQETGPGETGGR